MVLTPKQKFQANESARVEMEKLSNQFWFHEALDAAMLQLINEVRLVEEKPSASYQQIVGASELKNILLGLGTKTPEPKTKTAGLNHNA